MSGNPALTYTTNVMFRCPDFASLHRLRARLPLHLRRPGRHLAHHRGDQRPRPLPHVDRRLDRQGQPLGGRYPRGAPARRRPRLRLRNSLGHALGAPRTGRRPLRHRARVPRRRRRAPDVADRRLRHEHRHPGRGRSRLEARGRHPRLGRRRTAALLRNRAPAGRGAQCQRSELEPRAHAVDPRASAAARRSSSRDRRATRRARTTAPGSPPRCGTSGSRSASISATATTARRSSGRTARRNRRSKPRPTRRPRGPAIARPHVCLPDGRSTLGPLRPRLRPAPAWHAIRPTATRLRAAAAAAGDAAGGCRSRSAGSRRCLPEPPRAGAPGRPRRLARRCGAGRCRRGDRRGARRAQLR